MYNSLIAIVTVMYIGIGLSLINNKQIGLGVSYLFYAGANVGLYLAANGV